MDNTNLLNPPPLYFVKRPNAYTARVTIPKVIYEAIECNVGDMIVMEVVNQKTDVAVVFTTQVSQRPPGFTLPYDVRVALGIESERHARLSPEERKSQTFPPLRFRIVSLYKSGRISA